MLVMCVPASPARSAAVPRPARPAVCRARRRDRAHRDDRHAERGPSDCVTTDHGVRSSRSSEDERGMRSTPGGDAGGAGCADHCVRSRR